MKTTIVRFIFGVPDNLPYLPKGWTWNKDVEDWLTATSADGRLWLPDWNGEFHEAKRNKKGELQLVGRLP